MHIKEQWNFNFSHSSYIAGYSSMNFVLSSLANINSSPTDNNSILSSPFIKIVLYDAKQIWASLSCQFPVHIQSNPPFYLFKYRCNECFKNMSTTRSQRKVHWIWDFPVKKSLRKVYLQVTTVIQLGIKGLTSFYQRIEVPKIQVWWKRK